MESLPDNAAHILVVDDDLRIRDALAQYLFQNGFRVTTAADSATAHSQSPPSHAQRPPEPQGLHFEGEHRLGAVKQLTFGGQNAEAYWSPDGTRLIYQWTKPEGGCDQIYVMKADGSERRMVSTGKGRTTCAYFIPESDRVLFSSTPLSMPLYAFSTGQ